MSNEIVEYGAGEKSGQQLIALALNQQADPAVLSKLMDLQERWEAQQARKAFVMAMAAFKQEAPAVLKKNDRVDFTTAKGRTAYNYANLGSIVQEITAILGKHELSATWNTCQDEKGNITVTCHVTHSAGHRESVTLTGPADDSGNKNRIQAIGSCVTYLQRYTLLAALGLATTDDDDDGRGHQQQRPETKPPINPPGKKSDKAPDDTPLQNVTIKVHGVTTKEGKTGEKEWKLYSIVSTDGVTYKTFSETYKAMADESVPDDKALAITFKTEKNGNLIVGMDWAA